MWGRRVGHGRQVAEGKKTHHDRPAAFSLRGVCLGLSGLGSSWRLVSLAGFQRCLSPIGENPGLHHFPPVHTVPDSSSSPLPHAAAPAPHPRAHDRLERRSSVSLALIFALRMLGLFLVLPVFALEARKYPGGDDPALVGLAMGIYGLTQAVLQLPLGMASDRFGKR